MIGQPAPRFVADPGVAERVIPAPAAVAVWRPAFGRSWASTPRPGRRSEPTRRRHPDPPGRSAARHAAAETGEASVLSRASLHRSSSSGATSRYEEEARRVGRLHARGLALRQIDLRGRRGEAHHALEHREMRGSSFRHFKAHARALGKATCAPGTASVRESRPSGRAGEIGEAAIEQQQRHALPGGEARVIRKRRLANPDPAARRCPHPVRFRGARPRRCESTPIRAAADCARPASSASAASSCTSTCPSKSPKPA